MNNFVAALTFLFVTTPAVAHNGEKHVSTNSTDSVFVFKYDQSVQCGKAGIAPARGEQRLENAGIEVRCRFKAHDGMMRPQACGRQSGNINVFEIPAEKLSDATDEGFKSVASLSGFSGNQCDKSKLLKPSSKPQPKPRPLPKLTDV